MDPNKHDPLDFLTEGRFSRRDLLKGLGVLGIGLTLSGTGLLRPATAEAARLWNHAPAAGEPEQVQDILDILATNEAFGVTLVGTILDNAAKGNYSPAIPPMVLKILTGVRAEEQFHLDFLKAAGGKLRTETFHIEDTSIFANPKALFKDLVELEDAAIAAVMASMHTFTREQRIDLLKANFQFAAEEAEHRLLANHALGSRPANDHAFAPALFGTVAEFYARLQQKGIIGGSGLAITYPGAGAIDPTGVIYRTPGGPLVECSPVPPGMPTTGAPADGTPWWLLAGLGAAGAGAMLRFRKRQQPDSAEEGNTEA
ncbi:MAG: twin-arginine translocation signal domain-containing protein [Chloroflexia bacterium]